MCRTGLGGLRGLAHTLVPEAPANDEERESANDENDHPPVNGRTRTNTDDHKNKDTPDDGARDEAERARL